VARSSSLVLLVTTLTLDTLVSGCVGDPQAVAEPFGLEGREGTLRFEADWTSRLEGSLVEGGIARLAYDPARATCTASRGGAPLWSVTAHYRNRPAVRCTRCTRRGMRPRPRSSACRIELTSPGELELWFENGGDATGCHTWGLGVSARTTAFTIAPFVAPRGRSARAGLDRQTPRP
jgi:hypothetical protein